MNTIIIHALIWNPTSWLISPSKKMTAILADDSNFTEICSQESIDNAPALVPVMAWHRTGDTPLPEPTLNQYTDAHMRQ